MDEARAKRYSNLKYSLSILDTFYLLLILFLFSGFQTAKILVLALSHPGIPHYLTLPLYFLILSVSYYLLSFPLNFCRSYMVERQFSLSNQKIGDWFLDQLKGGILGYILGLILIGAFYFILKISPDYWWMVISIFWILFSVVIAKLTPILIIPLFFKYKKLEDELLRSRILKLAEKMQVKILDVFEIDLSKKSLKANAAFVGVGGTRRVLLADTLKDKYSHDEVEVILAHEFAHYKLKHILKLIFFNSAITILAFYIIFKSSTLVLKLFGLASLSDYASLPVVFIYFVLFGIITQPLEALISRIFEKDADMLALKTTGAREAFISTMDKLATQNLADRKPHPVIKFYFFDHPPIDERIGMARNAKLD